MQTLAQIQEDGSEIREGLKITDHDKKKIDTEWPGEEVSS